MTLITPPPSCLRKSKCSSVVSTHQGQSIKKLSVGGVNQQQNNIKEQK